MGRSGRRAAWMSAAVVCAAGVCAAAEPTTAPATPVPAAALLREADDLLRAWWTNLDADTRQAARLQQITQDALAKVQQAQRQDTRDPRIPHRLGICLSLLNRFPEAEAAFEEAEAACSGAQGDAAELYPIVLQDRGLCALRQRQYDRALDYFEQVLRVRDWQPETRYYIGTIYEGRGMVDRALDYYTQELNHNSHSPRTWQAYWRLKGGDAGGGRSWRNTFIVLGIWLAVLAAVALFVRRRMKRATDSQPPDGF
jgi:tetratricopeptide (TPR) repeat protein